MRILPVVLLAVPLVVCSAEAKHVWMAGKVLDGQTTEQFRSYVTASSVPAWRSPRHYLLATGSVLYLCADRGTKIDLRTGVQTSRPYLIEGTVVYFYIDGIDLVVIDNSGHIRREMLLMQRSSTEDVEVPRTQVRPFRTLPVAPSTSTLSRPSKHALEDISRDGKLLLLDDETAWRIDESDSLRVKSWLRPSSVMVIVNADGTCTLVRLGDGETATAHKIE